MTSITLRTNLSDDQCDVALYGGSNMSTGRIKHLPVSVRQRLQNLRDKTGEDYQLLLLPLALREQFAEDPVKQTQWEGFLNRSGLSDAPMKLSTVIETLNTFLTPLLSAAEEDGGYNQVWRDGGPWKPRS